MHFFSTISWNEIFLLQKGMKEIHLRSLACQQIRDSLAFAETRFRQKRQSIERRGRNPINENPFSPPPPLPLADFSARTVCSNQRWIPGERSPLSVETSIKGLSYTLTRNSAIGRWRLWGGRYNTTARAIFISRAGDVSGRAVFFPPFYRSHWWWNKGYNEKQIYR